MFMGLQAKGRKVLTAAEIQHSPLTEKSFVHEKEATLHITRVYTLSVIQYKNLSKYHPLAV